MAPREGFMKAYIISTKPSSSARETKKIVYNPEINKCMMHWCKLVLALQPWKNFLIRNSTNMKMMRNLIAVVGHYGSSNIDNLYSTYEECKETLIDVIDYLTRHSYIAKLKISSSWYRKKSEATTGVRNTVSYIPWLYTTWNQIIASNMIPCVIH